MKTRSFLAILSALLLCVSCGKKAENAKFVHISEIDWLKPDSTETLEERKGLNDIRFGQWTENDWYDNDYFRFLRQTFDEAHKGIKNENTKYLQDYNLPLDTQFVIWSAEPFLLGGMVIYLAFIDSPSMIYETSVCSGVGEDGKITGYSLFGFRESEMKPDYTKDEVLAIIKENPQHKLW